MLKKSGLIFKSPVATVSRKSHLRSFIMSMASSVFTLSCYMQCHLLSVLIRIYVIHPNIVSNLIFHCNHCDANTAFITIHDSTAAASSGPSGSLNAKLSSIGALI